MIERPITVRHEKGLEARPIAFLVQEASQYSSQIHLLVGTKKINAKSIMGMMSLSLMDGDLVTVVADGKDEEEAADGIEKFLEGVK
ncbi:HPr-like protein Crh [Mediterraneibacter butyricigenes]|jgi:catabolite repression HPr-like protein|uniref:HPr-like protein Crh n=1 Tax=Mediterraneibacter butyricigenes TaxID=2316025 RepID=A0A391P245_9FIRM|nr:HPr family phosphocarrier protein [Mediterraneibacter butyricigenes]RGV97001.1 HPr family phosphocarrier protein [Ruminococcus sp. AF14-10]GCA67417.1 HPr-like protein Crh [Mediterraneibacter butyricigenes]